MGYQNQTKIQREEAYVNSHAASVDRTINSREFRLGTLSYVELGHVPHDHFWSALSRQERHDPSGFFAHNPQYVGFFTAPAKLGELPQNNVIFDVMKDRDLNQHATFVAHHPFYVGMVDRDLRLEARSLTLPAALTTSASPAGSQPGIAPPSDLLVGPLSPPANLLVGPPSPPAFAQVLKLPTPSGGPGSPNSPVIVMPDSSPTGPGSTGVVPEPASILMVVIGLVAAVGLRRFSTHP